MKQTGTKLKGYRLNKEGRIEKIQGFGLNSSARIAKRKNAEKPKVVSRKKAGG